MPVPIYDGVPIIVIMLIILGIGANVGLAFIPAYIAKNKGYSFGAFWCIGFFASFVIGLIIAVCLPEKTLYQPYGYQNPQGQFSSYCSKCGHGLVGGDPYCPGCGSKVQ